MKTCFIYERKDNKALVAQSDLDMLITEAQGAAKWREEAAYQAQLLELVVMATQLDPKLGVKFAKKVQEWQKERTQASSVISIRNLADRGEENT